MNEKHLITFYTRTPLHVGSGATVEVVDLPVARERTTGYPHMPGSGLKGVFLQRARELWGQGNNDVLPVEAKVLFGDEDMAEASAVDSANEAAKPKRVTYAGCAQFVEAKLLVFPVRSLAGCFAWLTCPTALARLQRDTGMRFDYPTPAKDKVVAGSDLVVPANGRQYCVAEEYALEAVDDAIRLAATAGELKKLCADPLFTAHIEKRLAVVNDENFQHYVTTCTEVVQRIRIDPNTRTVQGTGLFTQEIVPCETLFYSIINLSAPRRPGHAGLTPAQLLETLLPGTEPPLLQFGGDETTGHGFCEVRRQKLPLTTNLTQP